MWWIYALLSALFAALTAIFAKAGLKEVNSDLATAIRTVFILFITWSIVFVKGNQDISGLSKSNWLFLILSASATGFSWLFYYKALQLGNTSAVSAIDKGSLIFVILLSFLFLREPVTAKLLLGAGLMLAGMLVIIWK
ncbi:MAG: EamA family transporter [Chitinophagaceae bacterium]|nr:EamA family transporter [Chitinophagaceae bacterium]